MTLSLGLCLAVQLTSLPCYFPAFKWNGREGGGKEEEWEDFSIEEYIPESTDLSFNPGSPPPFFFTLREEWE